MNTEKVIKRDQKYIMHTYARSPLVLEHNTFYLRDGVPFVRARMDGGSYTEKEDTILPLP